MGDSITCQVCGRTSHNPNDIREGYCGFCHQWTYGIVGMGTLAISWSLLHDKHDVLLPTKASRWYIFSRQYRLCRTRSITRPLGVWHAIKHAWREATR